MDDLLKIKNIKYFYLSDIAVSFALGMIPLTTVLSYLISSLSNSTFWYALILALYNIFTTIPKLYVAKNLSNKENTFNSILKFKLVQIIVWLLISIVFFTLPDSTEKVITFCILYLIYAFIKGSIDILNIDIYSRVIPSDILGKFFGYKYSLNSLGEFLGAMGLISIFNFLNIEVHYGIIFMIVFMLDAISFIILFVLRSKISLGILKRSGNEIKANPISSYLNNDKRGINKFKKASREIYDIIRLNDTFRSFLLANIISIIGASVASFFIPYATEKLNLSMNIISIANGLWLTSKVISAVFWGYIVDCIGAKYTMIGSRVALLLSYFIAIKLDSIFMFCLMLILNGVSSSALVIMAQNIFIEMGKDNGPLYSAINSLVCMPFFVIMPLVSNYLSEQFGYSVSFAISTVPLIISLILMFGVKINKRRLKEESDI